MVGRPAMNARLIGGAVEKAAATGNYLEIMELWLSLSNASSVSCYCDSRGGGGCFVVSGGHDGKPKTAMFLIKQHVSATSSAVWWNSLRLNAASRRVPRKIEHCQMTESKTDRESKMGFFIPM